MKIKASFYTEFGKGKSRNGTREQGRKTGR